MGEGIQRKIFRGKCIISMFQVHAWRPSALIYALLRERELQKSISQRPGSGAPGFSTSGPAYPPAVARRRDVTGSEAWDWLRPGEASPPLQPRRPASASQLFVGLGVRVGGTWSLLRPRPPSRRRVRGLLPPCLAPASLGRWGGPPGGLLRCGCRRCWRTGAVPTARAARHVPGLGRRHSEAGDLSEPGAMTATCSRLARLPRRRWRRLVRFPPPLLLLLLLLAAVGPAHGWESGDLELFDLVEEVQLNFYQFLGVEQVSGAAGRPECRASFGRSRGEKRASPGGREGVGRAWTRFPRREPVTAAATRLSWVPAVLLCSARRGGSS